MYINYSFRSFERKDTDRVRKFILSQNLGYPKYDTWGNKAVGQVVSGEKQAILAYSDGYLVGDVIFQEHRQLDRFIEIKNMRVHPDLRMRDFGRFMEKQVERYAVSLGYNALICDIREDKPEIVCFFVGIGFIPVATLSLYEEDKKDVTLVKFLRNLGNEKQELIERVHSVIHTATF